MLVSPTVFANTSANINVLGEIKPPTCLINGASQSDVVFTLPTISPRFLKKSNNYDISNVEKIKKEITITCDAETYLTFKVSDTYPSMGNGLASYLYYFSLVSSKETDKEVGAIMFGYEDMKVDSNEAYISTVLPSTSTSTNTNVLYKNTLAGWSKTNNRITSDAALLPVLKSGRIFSFTLSNILTYIYPTDNLIATGIDLTSEVNYQGEAILTFNFGV